MKKIFFLIITLSLLVAVFAFTSDNSWKLKPDYSIKFSCGDVSGIFKTFKGTIIFDENNLTSSKFNVKVDVSSINTGNGLQNKHAKGKDWLDNEKYPFILYNSDKIEKTGTDYKVTGILEMHGVKKEQIILFTFKKNGNEAVFKGSFPINRIDYNIGIQEKEVPEIIKIDLSIPVKK